MGSTRGHKHLARFYCSESETEDGCLRERTRRACRSLNTIVQSPPLRFAGSRSGFVRPYARRSIPGRRTVAAASERCSIRADCSGVRSNGLRRIGRRQNPSKWSRTGQPSWHGRVVHAIHERAAPQTTPKKSRKSFQTLLEWHFVPAGRSAARLAAVPGRLHDGQAEEKGCRRVGRRSRPGDAARPIGHRANHDQAGHRSQEAGESQSGSPDSCPPPSRGLTHNRRASGLRGARGVGPQVPVPGRHRRQERARPSQAAQRTQLHTRDPGRRAPRRPRRG